MTRFLAVAFLYGCYSPPDLPLIDAVPIESPPFKPCHDPDLDVSVGCTIDGDTFDLIGCGGDFERIRLLGIDAPEIAHSPNPADCGGDEAAAVLADWLEGEKVSLTYDKECVGTYGRTLAYVWARGDLYNKLMRDRDIASFSRRWVIQDQQDTVTTTATGNRPGRPETENALLLNEVLLGLGIALQYPEEIVGTIRYQGDFDRATSRAMSQGLGVYGTCL